MRALAIAGLLLAMLAPGAAFPDSSEEAAERGLRVLEDRSADAGDLRPRAVLRPGDSLEPGALATLELLLPLRPELEGVTNPTFRVFAILARIDDEPLVLPDDPAAEDLSGAEAWLWRKEVELPLDFVEAAVVVEELRSGLWGAAPAPLSEQPLPTPAGRLAAAPAPIPAPAAEPAAPPPAPEDAVLRILPPRSRPATGRTRFQVLTTITGIDHVVFFLDGEEVETDDRAPFGANLDLGPEVAPHTVRAVAYTSGGLALGEHSLTVNQIGEPFRVAITAVRGEPLSGQVEVEVEVAIPLGEELSAVEFYWNESLGTRLDGPPFRAQLSRADPGPDDYVRVVALLASGDAREDARLLADAGAAERVEVNLVELYVVVTDREGRPVPDLGAGDFTVTRRGRPQTIERFAMAEEVPLVLGVVIDTSESMWPLMPDTKQAGAQFLAETVREGDRAFLIDFDTRPRLARAVSGDVTDLIRGMAGMRADGFTALYDAIIFSLLQFEEVPGRKALVLLTDGDDYRSRFGQSRCIEYGRELGVPVYIIGLGGIQDPRRGLRKIDLEGITEATGGRIFYIGEPAELTEAYARINAELRSQYLLTFTTDRPLSRQELDTIRVRAKGRGLEVRTVVAGSQIR